MHLISRPALQTALLIIALATPGCDYQDYPVNSPCETNTDCASEICHTGICAAKDPRPNGATCKWDGECRSINCRDKICKQNNRTNGQRCLYGSECAGNKCNSNVCSGPDGGVDAGADATPDMALPDLAAPTCTDKLQNGQETDVDCGGSTCNKCGDGKKCSKATDCLGGTCSGGECTKGCVHQPVVSSCKKDSDGMQWCTIPSGCFQMGSPKSEPCREPGKAMETKHPVTLSSSFEIMALEVSQGAFNKAMGFNPSANTTCGLTCPVETVNWHHAAGYCNLLSKQAKLGACYNCAGSGKNITCITAMTYKGSKVYTCPGYRLPTEAEFEYAYRAGTTGSIFSTKTAACSGEVKELNAYAWYKFNSLMKIHVAGTVKKNPWGLFDMGGNVWEWCQDWFVKDLGSSAVVDPGGPSTSDGKLIRGGSNSNDAAQLRSAFRSYVGRTHVDPRVGFRCVRTLYP